MRSFARHIRVFSGVIAAALAAGLLAGCTAPPSPVLTIDGESSSVAELAPAAEAGPNVASDLLDFTDSSGATSDYRVYLPANGTSTTHPGLILQFHGDGGGEFFEPELEGWLGGADGIIAQGTSRGYVVVPVLAPDRDGAPEWWTSGEANAIFAHELLLRLEAEYGIDTSNIWLVGYSGGAQFITEYFLPSYSGDFAGGGAVLFGGGADPKVPVESFTPSFVADFPMHWVAGSQDVPIVPWNDYSGLEEALAGLDWYDRAGFATSFDSPDLGHDLSGWFGPVLGQQLDEHAR